MTVYLVGAGPGHPDLLTVKAARLLDTADVVVHDRLVDPRVLDLIAPWAEVIDVGKRPGGPADAQDRIHRVLVAAAGRADTVVRLKGGDPFVFGRGGEEAEALRRAGVDVEVVPGITSAIAGPAAAGIPVTMRGHASGFTVITGHQDPTADRPIDWEAAARLGTTLVVLMGASRVAHIADQLMAGGLAADTPVAAIESATTPHQRVKRTTLGELPGLPVLAPAVLVIGTVAALDVTDSGLSDLVTQLADDNGGVKWHN
ncbi:MAG TPA: uroporphyrinogen-III C-methyltransferase [Acidimicrobiia bacterium]|jgi:uroporphyrin-III C-methyltransferase|nr:uroporphyrinogen-III C-methyltransferase [Acidimicrobiales bacterium]HBL07546.1 uroporphyrinogen-III C-methyltransferase [Acidimicrobiaceae bacterium]HIM66672.1 uroporphyrinogen-III C-methyltransferase [Acidimicrobiia bacterium]HIM85281.1 uroporphyrinogen-III C-methyltransferase [Acidimicrobiia bacterium]